MDEHIVYQAIEKILQKGNNVEIRRKPNGEWQILEIKKNIVL